MFSVWFPVHFGLYLLLNHVKGVEYLMAGQNVGCSDYPGYSQITTKSECDAAAVAMGTGCSDATELSQNIYPSYCYFNKAGSSCNYRLYFNSDPSTTTGSSTRFPICKSTSDPSAICTDQLGNAPTGSSTTPDISDASLYVCPSTWTFSPYEREGRMYFSYNPREQTMEWGFQQWPLNMDASGTTYSTLYSLSGGDSFYDSSEGIAIDNTRNVGYTMISHKYASTGTSYERWLMQIDLDTGVGTALLHDYYPFNCHHLNTPGSAFRPVLDIDEGNNILYWMDENPDTLDLILYSLDINVSPLQVKVEISLDWATFSDQLSQLVVDCNGNVWFTEIFNGLYLYKPGWNTAVKMIGSANLNGISIIRRDNSVEMDWIIASKFTLRKYEKSAIQSQSNSFTPYPSPPHSPMAGSTNDIMHYLVYDYQNEIMCANTDTSDGNFMLFCYDPAGDPNLVWNYVKGPLEREGLGIRFGSMATPEPTPSPITKTPTTAKPTDNPTPQPTANPVKASYTVCDVMDETSVQYYWIGGEVATSTAGCASDPDPCFKIKGTSSAQKRINTVGLKNIQLQWWMYLWGVDGGSGERVYLEYDCDSLGWVTGPEFSTNEALTYHTYVLTDTACEDNRNVKIRFRIAASMDSEYAYIDDFCVYGETPTVPAPLPPLPLPYCETNDWTVSGYWADYVAGSASNTLQISSSSYCPGGGDCFRFYGYHGQSSTIREELNFIDFNVKSSSRITVNFNLCFDCDSGSLKMNGDDNFYVNYACDGTFNWKNAKTYNGDVYGPNEVLMNEKVLLPAECDYIDNLRIQFAMDGSLSEDYVYLDSFCINRVTDAPTPAPTPVTSNPTTSQPTTVQPTVVTANPTTNAPTTASPTTNVCGFDAMDDISLWAEQSLGSIFSSSLATRCETPDCMVIEYTDSDIVSYITRAFDATDCSNICLSYSYGYSFAEGDEDIYLKYSCNDGQDWILYEYRTNKATGTDYGITGNYNLHSDCNNNDNVLIRFEYHGNDYEDRLYIDNLYLYRGCSLTAQTYSPTTSEPTTAQPTGVTSHPTTNSPTASPSTQQPTTNEPTTDSPTTSEPTTAEPTTNEPTTTEPTTNEPTEAHIADGSTAAGADESSTPGSEIVDSDSQAQAIQIPIMFFVFSFYVLCVSLFYK